jgi:hypothetical protein
VARDVAQQVRDGIMEDAGRVIATTGSRIEAALVTQAELTKEAIHHAKEAYKEANTVNQKIASLGGQLTAERQQEQLERELPPHGEHAP